jgi:hypothetical protein
MYRNTANDKEKNDREKRKKDSIKKEESMRIIPELSVKKLREKAIEQPHRNIESKMKINEQ